MNADDLQAARVLLGRAIQEAREKQGCSVSDLAAASGISQRTIARIEAGDRESDFELLIALADGLGVQPSTLFIRVAELDTTDS